MNWNKTRSEDGKEGHYSNYRTHLSPIVMVKVRASLGSWWAPLEWKKSDSLPEHCVRLVPLSS